MKAGDILRQAADLIEGDRAKEHGDFTILAEDLALLWELHLKRIHGVSVCFTPWDVAMMLKNLKDARMLQNPRNIDNYRDGGGYTALAAREVRKDVPD